MKLRDLLKFNQIVVQCHDNPDADTLASGYGVYLYLKDHGKDVRLVYSGPNKIRKSNLLMMIRELEIPVEYVESIQETELLVTVDCQYKGGNVTDLKGKQIAVIDHHRVGKELPELREVQSLLGACSTLVWKLLKEEGYPVNENRKLVTALYYGLYTDTDSFAEIYHPLDKQLRDEAEVDTMLVTKFRNANFSVEELETVAQALLQSKYYEEYRLAVVKSGPCDPNVLGIISDLVLKVDVVDTSLAYSATPTGVKISIRSCDEKVMANELAAEICGNMGSGGGHLAKAGGFMPAEVLKEKGLSQEELTSFFAQGVIEYMKKRKKAVIFDLDGTLLDTLEDLKNAVNAALKRYEMPERTLTEVRQFVGNGIRNLMIRAVPEGEKNPHFEEVFAFFKSFYKEHCKENTKPYDGILDMLEELSLRGMKMAIVSNKIDTAVKELNDEHFKAYTQAAIGEMPGVERKPAPDMVNKALEILGVEKEDAIYVGDSEVDILTAKNAGMQCISVTWGFRDAEFLKEHGAEMFIHHPQELSELV